MKATSKRSFRVADALGWCLLGGVAGVVLAFLIFIKTAAVFESDAIVQVRHDPDAASRSTERKAARDPSLENGRQSLELSGLRISDDAAGDQLVYDLPESQEVNSTNSELQHPTQTDDFDDSLLLGSEKLLAEAIELAGLADITVLTGGTGGSPTEFGPLAREIQQAGRLKVRQLRRSSRGEVYRITFRAGQPKASKLVVDALLEAAHRFYQQPVKAGSWQEAITLLFDARLKIDQRIDDLRRETQALQLPVDAMLWERDVESQLSMQLKQLNGDLNRIHDGGVLVEQQLRLAEVLMDNGVAPKAVLTTLIGHRTDSLPSSEKTREPSPVDQAEERKTWLKERDRFMKELNSELKPLEDELEQMLTKYAAKHPAIVYQKVKIARLKSRLSELPPDPAERSVVVIDEDQEVQSGPVQSGTPKEMGDAADDFDKEANTALISLLDGLRARHAEIMTENQTLEQQRMPLIARIARQKVALLRAKELSRELQQQQDLRADLLARLAEIEGPPESRPRSLEVLRAAGSGSRIEPRLEKYLVFGGGGGVLLGIMVGAFLSAFAGGSVQDSKIAS